MRAARWSAPLLTVTVAACGRLSFDPLASSSDGGDSGDGASGDALRPQTCGAWEPIQRIDPLATTSDDWEPAISPDGNTLVFGRGTEQLYMALRLGDSFGPSALITALDAPGASDFGATWVSPTELYFSSTRLAAGNFRLWRSTFDGSAFQPPTQIAELATVDVFSATVRGDGLEMYYNATETGDHQLYRAVRASTSAPWTLTGLQSQLTLGGVVGWSSFSPDGLSLYYEYKAQFMSDIYVATRASIDDLFSPGEIVSELATGDNGDPEVSRDGTTIYFSYAPVTGTDGFDLYSSTRTCMAARSI